VAATDYAHRVIIVPFLSALRRQASRSPCGRSRTTGCRDNSNAATSTSRC
jgi:hypothetical protein